jgi:rhodanese-related sulfurtransferase
VEVLERRQYELAHLPGAVHIPAWELTRERAGELDRARPVVVYCFDTL